MILEIDDDTLDTRETDLWLYFEQKDRKLLEELRREPRIVVDGHTPIPTYEVWLHNRCYTFQGLSIGPITEEDDLLKVGCSTLDLLTVADYTPRVRDIKR